MATEASTRILGAKNHSRRIPTNDVLDPFLEF